MRVPKFEESPIELLMISSMERGVEFCVQYLIQRSGKLANLRLDAIVGRDALASDANADKSGAVLSANGGHISKNTSDVVFRSIESSNHITQRRVF